jgi:hypothetical protein
VWALPESFEVWFLSPNKTAYIKLPKEIKFYSKIASNDLNLTCQKYGEYCFDPQVGLYKEDDQKGVTILGDEALEVKDDKKIIGKAEVDKNRVKSVMDGSMIECKKDNFFDIFCGIEQKINVSKTKVEIWMDTSSSLRVIDPSDESGGCRRRSFASSLKAQCSGADIYSFNTHKRYQSDLANLCMNYGLNDERRLIRWIKESKAKHLIVITDIGEYTATLSDFISENNGYVRGTEMEDIVTSSKMKELVNDVAKYCKKK